MRRERGLWFQFLLMQVRMRRERLERLTLFVHDAAVPQFAFTYLLHNASAWVGSGMSLRQSFRA